jgi:uncharacterized protein (UPF0333 family)
MLDFLLNLLSPIWQPILATLGVVVAGVVAYFGGKAAQKKDDVIATQKETIHAHETRAKVDAAVAAASPDERERLRNKWRRRSTK